ncbi:response regulator [Alteromonas sp. ASW11-130]|uniref:response regulator n=1 Tax=Alteromonas sp. ASW11-130 TaxID=3015775 RepID=UPI0022418DBB|nr:response regulator [Alteromonas sp. ASW11-130]MCW8092963.1 response regulator [Alteromonas sp. ASW11-130]
MRSFQDVLCIDDDDEYNFLTQEAFYDYNYTGKLTFMRSAEEALEYLAGVKSFPDIIILDINMPRLNGWDFLEKYEANAFHHHFESLIFMHSSSVFEPDKERAARFACVKGFIDKPILLEDLERITKTYFS